MGVTRRSRSEAEERRLFESWWSNIKDRPPLFDGQLHAEYGIWFYDDEATNEGWQAWRERAHLAGSFQAIPGMDPAYKALEDALAACRAELVGYPNWAYKEGVEECINAIEVLRQAQAKAP
jgi:hypothetical protein